MAENSEHSRRGENVKNDNFKQGYPLCEKCGKTGHKTEDCFRPIVCGRCKKEGHVARVCVEIKPWECIAPFCGFAAPGQGIHVIQDDNLGDNQRDMSNWALITVIEGTASSRQIENEFKAQAGPNSNWRWYAKKVADNKFQLKFPTAGKVEDLAFFTGMKMRTVPDVTIKVDKWNPHSGAKAELSSAWFRIFGIPMESRTETKACLVGSMVGVPLEVDKVNLKRWEFVRVKIGCRDLQKVPAVVEGLLDFHFYVFSFQREVVVEGTINSAGNTWTRNSDRAEDEHPSPKKPRWGGGEKGQQSKSGATHSTEGTSGAGAGNQLAVIPNKLEILKGVTKACGKQKQKSGQNLEDLGREYADLQKPQEDVNSGEESEDQGLYMGDIIAPSGDHLNFGAFENTEIRNLWKMQIDNSKSVVINEYGSNLHKNSFDSLAVIEAKIAMKGGQKEPSEEVKNVNKEVQETQLQNTLVEGGMQLSTMRC
ncbi:unnamed protein product [Urochloa humidicola]